ncbi:MAG: hypothetical protein ACT4P1_12250 [Sporichthyaceae bacterium]
MLSTNRSARLRRRCRGSGDGGYALLSVIGFGTAIVLTVGAVGGYAIQTMDSAGRTQGSSAAVQAAQAGVDDFVARQMADASYVNAPLTTWRPVPGSVDGNGTPCVDMAGSLPPNCPEFRHSAVLNPATGLVTVTSTGRSRGLTRAVEVVLKARAFTDYLYYSEIEAADPADRFVYPFGPPASTANCDKPASGGRLGGVSSPCRIPTWRGDDSTAGSRVHTDDVFEVIGTPTFDSRISAAIGECAAQASACVRKTFDANADPDYNEGPPAFADDLMMPGSQGLDQLRSAAGAVGGCTYYGPTRIRFQGDKMRVWSPQTPPSAACGGGVSSNLRNALVNVVVTSGNTSLLGNLLGLSACIKLGSIKISGTCPGDVVPVSLGNVLDNALSPVGGLLAAVNGIVATGDLVSIPANGAIYVRDNPTGTTPPTTNPPDPTFLQCLIGSALGMYTTIDTNLTAGLLNNLNAPLAGCRAGKLFVDGVLDGRVTAGVSGDIVIMSDLTHAGEDDRLGLVATGPVEVYNPLQCTLAAATCLSTETLVPDLLTSLGGLRSAAGTGNLTQILGAVPGYGDDVTVEASIISLTSRFGMQLPILSLGLSASVLNALVNLNIDPPTLTVRGSVAQYYRGVIGADLLTISPTLPGLNLASANVDIGFRLQMDYDESLRTSPPPFLPMPTAVIWDAQSFAEIEVPAV